MQTNIGTDIAYAGDILRRGGVVAIPTETVYGLAANALDEDAVLHIYTAKERPRFNPLILHVHGLEAFSHYAASIPAACLALAEAFCPGPLTFLLPKKSLVPDLVTAGSERVALRIPRHPMTLALLQDLGLPLAAPSANPSGTVSPVTADHVLQGLSGRIPYVLNGGPCQVGLESTIVGFEQDQIILYRYGAITLQQLERVSGMRVQEADKGGHETPGRLRSHYATRTPMLVCNIQAWLSEHPDTRAAAITFQETHAGIQPGWCRALSPAGDLQEAARALFHAMRSLDALGADIILAEPFPDAGLGKAINDRLDRAQSIYK
ncbi:MAG: threonylcarbamoyl-AMP synthase [Bacteroidetes bacterium]|nr:threonylcarbamoyl-AMP synthase [Bacteroidota bacterium]